MTPIHYRDLAMQRQPTPKLDPLQKGHFLWRKDALAGGNVATEALTDLSDLPSQKQEGPKAEAKLRAKRDERATKAAGLKSWDGKKLRCTVTCYECLKARGVYTRNDETYYAAREALQQKLESVFHRFCCGNLLFDDDHPLGQTLC